jgi:hypothetical protein
MATRIRPLRRVLRARPRSQAADDHLCRRNRLALRILMQVVRTCFHEATPGDQRGPRAALDSRPGERVGGVQSEPFRPPASRPNAILRKQPDVVLVVAPDQLQALKPPADTLHLVTRSLIQVQKCRKPASLCTSRAT